METAESFLNADRLITAAREAMSRSYGVKHGDRNFGAAVLTIEGTIFASGVYKSDTSSLTIHAEHGALVHAAAHGKHAIVAIAIVSDEDPSGLLFTNPCGMCKQLLYESSRRSGMQMAIVLTNGNGEHQIKNLSEFIVYPWPS